MEWFFGIEPGRDKGTPCDESGLAWRTADGLGIQGNDTQKCWFAGATVYASVNNLLRRASISSEAHWELILLITHVQLLVASSANRSRVRLREVRVRRRSLARSSPRTPFLGSSTLAFPSLRFADDVPTCPANW